MGMDSHDYGRQVVPQFAVCKLEIRKAAGIIASETKNLRIRHEGVGAGMNLEV
jgi:hypothetical protein